MKTKLTAANRRLFLGNHSRGYCSQFFRLMQRTRTKSMETLNTNTGEHAAAADKVRCAVDGMMMKPAAMVKVEQDGKAYYFCNEIGRQKCSRKIQISSSKQFHWGI